MSDPQPAFGMRRALSVEDLMKSADQLTLDELVKRLFDPSGSEADAERQAVAAVAPTFAAWATSAAGREMLEFLADKTVRRPHFVTGMNVEQAALYAASRGGQDGLFFLILKMIAEGERQLGQSGGHPVLERRAAERLGDSPKSKPAKKGARR